MGGELSQKQTSGGTVCGCHQSGEEGYTNCGHQQTLGEGGCKVYIFLQTSFMDGPLWYIILLF